MKFKLDENLPVSSAAILTNVGHDVDTVTDEGLVGAPDRDVVAAATAAGRILKAVSDLATLTDPDGLAGGSGPAARTTAHPPPITRTRAASRALTIEDRW